MSAEAKFRAPTREDYAPSVRTFLPGCDGEELQMRSALLLMRDRAMATKPICSEEGWAILDLVERTASRDAFRPMPLDELKEVRRLCVMLVATASGFDALYGRVGGSDGRG
jgi:hypothetical protein